MTHILLDIKYINTEPILYDKNRGESVIKNWCEYNNHTLVMPPISHVFPSFNDRNTTMIIEDFYPQKMNPYSSEYYSLGNDENVKNVKKEYGEHIQNKDYNGYTSIGMLKESHISIHTYPELNSIQIDFFSCKNLNKQENVEYIERVFKKSRSVKFDYRFIERKI